MYNFAYIELPQRGFDVFLVIITLALEKQIVHFVPIQVFTCGSSMFVHYRYLRVVVYFLTNAFHPFCQDCFFCVQESVIVHHATLVEVIGPS